LSLGMGVLVRCFGCVSGYMYLYVEGGDRRGENIQASILCKVSRLQRLSKVIRELSARERRGGESESEG
jgi:hypothetical protein